MPKEQAMNLTFGDLIILEIALVMYMNNLDLSMQSGQYISELIGKLEYNMAEIKATLSASAVPGYDPTTHPDKINP